MALKKHPRGRDRWLVIIAITGLIVSTARLAQAAEEGTAELSGYTGVTAGSISAHPAVGASSGIYLSRYGAALIDLSFMPLGGNTLQPYPGQVKVNNSALYDLNLSGQIRIPLRRKWEPYGIAGVAFLFSTYRIASTDAEGAVVYRNRSDSDVGFETGGGVRYFLAKNWGLRTEFRYTLSNRNFGRFLAGAFYQFEGEGGFRLRRPGSGRLSAK